MTTFFNLLERQSCSSGYYACSDGDCCRTSQNCAPQVCCDKPRIACGYNGCYNEDTEVCCHDRSTSCDKGYDCMPQSGCCKSGQRHCGSTSQCYDPKTSVCCANGRLCDKGWDCVEGGCCQSGQILCGEDQCYNADASICCTNGKVAWACVKGKKCGNLSNSCYDPNIETCCVSGACQISPSTHTDGVAWETTTRGAGVTASGDSSSSSSSNNHSRDDKKGVKIGVTVAVPVASLFAIGFRLIWCMKRRRAALRERQHDQPPYTGSFSFQSPPRSKKPTCQSGYSPPPTSQGQPTQAQSPPQNTQQYPVGYQEGHQDHRQSIQQPNDASYQGQQGHFHRQPTRPDELHFELQNPPEQAGPVSSPSPSHLACPSTIISGAGTRSTNEVTHEMAS